MHRALLLLIMLGVCLLPQGCGPPSGPVVSSAFTTNEFTYGKEATPVAAFSQQDETVYVVMQLDNVLPQTKTRIVWTAVEVRNATGSALNNVMMSQKEGTVEI